MTTWRYLAQRGTTGQWLHTELPLRRASGPSWALSAAGSFSATVAPAIGTQTADDGRPLLEEWSTLIHAEADGRIRWSGIVVASRFEGQEWHIEAMSLMGYPRGIPYGGEYSRTGVDPADVIAHIWEHVQSHPDAKLGVRVVGDKTPVRLGTPKTADADAEPYELAWYDGTDCGAEVETLATSTPLDLVEEHAWSSDKSAVEHRVRISHPRAGRRRDDLVFIHGDNVVSVASPQRDGDEYANEVIGLGAGEGRGSIRTTTAVRDGRLRRPYVLEAKDIGNRATLTALAREELAYRRQLLTIPSIDVVDHSNAHLGSWSLGDDIRVQARLPWLGAVDLWHRVVEWELLTDNTARLHLERADARTYGG